MSRKPRAELVNVHPEQIPGFVASVTVTRADGTTMNGEEFVRQAKAHARACAVAMQEALPSAPRADSERLGALGRVSTPPKRQNRKKRAFDVEESAA